jgi:antitoxin (DNA-binding transcriptional repressor) of toxin-antitoxin stability system
MALQGLQDCGIEIERIEVDRNGHTIILTKTGLAKHPEPVAVLSPVSHQRRRPKPSKQRRPSDRQLRVWRASYQYLRQDGINVYEIAKEIEE